MLQEAVLPLREVHDLAVLDLDGVVYVGDRAVPRAPEALLEFGRHGGRWAFITNSASRPPLQTAQKLNRLGIPAQESDVVTSAQAAARLLAAQLPTRSKVFVIGGDGLTQALRQFELVPTTTSADDIRAVVQGYGPEMPWKQVLDGVLLVGSGLPWVATNTDLTIPLAGGIGPGNGALVKLVSDFTGRTPQVAGKPQRPLFEETQLRMVAENPLMVGDRLDTDIEGARQVGWSSLLVLTGVTDLDALIQAGAEQRPDYIAASLDALNRPHPAPSQEGAKWCLNGWAGDVVNDSLRIQGQGSVDDWWRVVAATAWEHLDRFGTCVDTSTLSQPWIG